MTPTTHDLNVGEDEKFKYEEAATFALIFAESGGGFTKNDDPTVQPLITGAILDNRREQMELLSMFVEITYPKKG